jgi:nicotinamidase-related amidase
VNVTLQPGDALLVVDVQRDFVAGSVAVPAAAEILPALGRYVGRFRERDLPIVATRDWHPPDHVSFHEQGGVWPAHCVAGSRGAEFAAGLALARDAIVVSKGTSPLLEAHSAFDGTELQAILRKARVHRLFVGGLATDYCVLATVKDALRLGYRVFLLADAVRAVDQEPDDGAVAMRTMLRLGAALLREGDLARASSAVSAGD